MLYVLIVPVTKATGIQEYTVEADSESDARALLDRATLVSEVFEAHEIDTDSIIVEACEGEP